MAQLDEIRELLNTATPLRKDCSNIVVSYLTPLPPLPFLRELQVRSPFGFRVHVHITGGLPFYHSGCINCWVRTCVDRL